MSELHETPRLAELDGERWRRIREVFDAALEMTGDGRRGYLDGVGRDAPEIRAYVDKLIAADAEAGEFMSSGPPVLPIPPSLEPPFTWGRLEVRARLGEGSYGAVYRAWDPVLSQDVALKLWHQPAAQPDRMVWEAHRSARVRHPNILVVHGVSEHDGRMGMWGELIDGTTLEHEIRVSGPRTAAEAVAIGVVVCDALAALHQAGLVHQDIKSTNVMRDRSGRVVLVDFGTARELTGAGVVPQEMPTGTPATMAPEQLTGSNVGPGADVYGVGVLLYRLVTGHFPIEAASVTELSQLHAQHAAVPLATRRPDLPPGFVAVVERALAPDPAARYASIGELQRALAGLPEGTDLPPPAPPAASAHASRMLPRPLTPFIGRQGPLRHCARLLAESRLLTLTGPGGSGKTRLALELGEREADRFTEGALLVDLGLVRTPAHVLDGIATALGVRPGADRTQQALETRFAGSHALLILDNCEHVLSGVADPVEQLLEACPRISVLATSRTPLGIAPERVYAVPPLELPGAADGGQAIVESEAVRLFVERASAVRYGFELNPAVAADVAEICRRLEGVPLAIELAASNARLLTPREILERVNERLLTLSANAMPARHRTLEAAIAWSVDLLEPEERLLLPALAVFEGGWTVSAAEAVCMPGAVPFLGRERLLRLVHASLVIVESNAHGGSRYRMLETVRQFAQERLQRSDVDTTTRLRRNHLAYFRAMAMRSEREFWGPRQAEWLSLLDEDHANLMAAARAATEIPGELENGLALGGALYRYWYSRGQVRQGRAILSELLGHPDARPDSENRLRALFAAAGLAVFEGEVAHARALFEEGLARAEALGPEKAARWRIGLSSVAQREGKLEESRALLLHSLNVYRAAGDGSSQIVVLHNLAELEALEGSLDLARKCEQETLDQARQTGNVLFEAVARIVLASIAARQGELVYAREQLRASAPGVRSIRAKVLGVERIESACQLALAMGDAPRAARWLDVATVVRETSGLIASPAQALATQSMRRRLAGLKQGITQGPRRADYDATMDEVERWLEGGSALP